MAPFQSWFSAKRFSTRFHISLCLILQKLQFENKEDKEALHKKTDQDGGDSPATSATNTDEEDNLAEATVEKSGSAKQKSDNEMLGSATGTDEEDGSKMEAGDKAVRRRKARREE